MKKIFLMLCCVVWMPTLSFAQEAKKTPMNISADQALEWRRDDQQYVARGNVVITQDDMRLQADQVVADYRDRSGAAADGSGPEIYRLTATGTKVVLKTATETAVGTRAVYDRDAQTATLDGPVTITRGQDVLQGARAVMDLRTKQSTLLADEKSGGRVSGVFYNTKPMGP